MIVSNKFMTLDGNAFVPDDPVPPSVWDSLRERTRRVLLRGKYVREGEPHVMVRHRVAGLHQPAPTPIPAPDPLICDVEGCGKQFATKQALGGHRRGHAKREEL